MEADSLLAFSDPRMNCPTLDAATLLSPAKPAFRAELATVRLVNLAVTSLTVAIAPSSTALIFKVVVVSAIG